MQGLEIEITCRENWRDFLGMKFNTSSLMIWLSAIFLFSCFSLNSLAGDDFSKANKIGKAHGPGCGSGFFDINGSCWSCPKGYKHDSIFLPPTNPKVCKLAAHTIKKTADYKEKSRVGFCSKNNWLDTKNGKCYRCSSGYTHNNTLHHDQKGVCWKKVPDKYSKASRMKGNLFCEEGSFDPIQGGTCWSCPSSHPELTGNPIDSSKACKTQDCGANNGRACLVTERIPSCDSGLAQNFLTGKCEPKKSASKLCMDTLTAINAGKSLPIFKNVEKMMVSSTHHKRDEYASKPKREDLITKLKIDIAQTSGLASEVTRISNRIVSNVKAVEKIFEAKNLCNSNIAEIDKQLISLGLKPKLPLVASTVHWSDFLIRNARASGQKSGFLIIGDVVSAGAGPGLSMSVSLLTNFDGQGAVILTLAPQYEFNMSAGVGFSVGYYPSISVHELEGWGWGIGANLGVLLETVGAEVGFNSSFREFQSISANSSIGPEVLPADMSFSYGYTWPLKIID